MDPVVVPTVSNEDQTTTKSTTPVTQQIGQTAQDASQVVVWGAFWGTLPIPESSKISETMPAFSFDEDDFNTEENNFPTSPIEQTSPNVVENPFAGGLTSLQTESENHNEPEGTISLDSLAQNNNPIPAEETVTDAFEIPTPANTIEATAEETPLSSESESESTSFNLPDENTHTEEEPLSEDQISLPESEEANDIIPEIDVELPKTEEKTEESSDSFDLPSEENPEPQNSSMEDNMMSVDTNENPTENTPDTSVDTVLQNDENNTTNNENNSIEENNTIPTFDFPNEIIEDNTSSEETTDLPKTEQENNTIINDDSSDDTISNSVDEQRDTKTHALTEDFKEFEKIFKEYISFTNKKSVQIVGLRTDDDEVIYTFDQSNDKNINITKSNTSDVINFTTTESGLQVMLNSESIAYYGIDEVDGDTTHYLKEKLSKFTMMIESELNKEKKAKEQVKKIKETLRSF